MYPVVIINTLENTPLLIPVIMLHMEHTNTSCNSKQNNDSKGHLCFVGEVSMLLQKAVFHAMPAWENLFGSKRLLCVVKLVMYPEIKT